MTVVLAIAEQMIAHHDAQDADAYVARGIRAKGYPTSAYSELVEGLHYSWCGARSLKEEGSASTSSASTRLVQLEVLHG